MHSIKKTIPNISMEGGSYHFKSRKQKLFFEPKLVNMRWTQAGTELGWLCDENNSKQQ